MPQIVTVDDLRLYLGHEGYEELVNPIHLIRSINSAERWCQNYTGRLFSADPGFVNGDDTADAITKTFSVRGRGWVRIPDLRESGEVAINDVPLTEDLDFFYDDYNVGGEPHT